MTGKFLRRGSVLLMLSGIFFLSHQPSIDVIPPLFPLQDKVLHAGEYFLLGVTLLLNRDLWRWHRPNLAIFVAGTIWGITDEIHQYFVPGRDCSIGDLAADMTGIALSIAVWSMVSRRTRIRSYPLDNTGE